MSNNVHFRNRIVSIYRDHTNFNLHESSQQRMLLGFFLTCKVHNRTLHLNLSNVIYQNKGQKLKQLQHLRYQKNQLTRKIKQIACAIIMQSDHPHLIFT